MTPRSGRPSGSSDARERILQSARELFSAKGFQQTTLRSVAREAGVDVALISHYFDNKRGLFLAVADFPVDPKAVLSTLDDVPVDELGSQLLRRLLTVWESPAGPGVIAVFRSSLTGDEEIVRTFITGLVMPEVAAHLAAASIPDVERRLPLAATQIAGVMVIRHLLRLEPIAGMGIDELVRALGPNLDRLLTGDID